jgi:hypothetical protein
MNRRKRMNNPINAGGCGNMCGVIFTLVRVEESRERKKEVERGAYERNRNLRKMRGDRP